MKYLDLPGDLIPFPIQQLNAKCGQKIQHLLGMSSAFVSHLLSRDEKAIRCLFVCIV